MHNLQRVNETYFLLCFDVVFLYIYVCVHLINLVSKY